MQVKTTFLRLLIADVKTGVLMRSNQESSASVLSVNVLGVNIPPTGNGSPTPTASATPEPTETASPSVSPSPNPSTSPTN